MPALGKGVVVAGAAGVLTAAGFLAWTVLSASEEATPDIVANPSQTAEHSPAPSVTQAVTASPTQGIPVDLQLAIGDPIEFPADVALIVETGCWGCDGGPGAFVRVYRRPDGSFAQDVLFRAEQLGLPDDGDPWVPYILDFAMRPASSEMAVAVCVTGYCGGLGFAEEGSVARLYRSADGGVTWLKWIEWPRDHYIVGLVEGGILAAHQVNAPPKPDDPQATPAPYVEPEFEYIVIPEGRVVPEWPHSNISPLVSDSGEIWWTSQGQLIDSRDYVQLEIGEPGAAISRIYGDVNRGFILGWANDQSGDYYYSRYNGSPFNWTRTWTMKSSFGVVPHIGPWDLDGALLYGNVDVAAGQLPTPTVNYYGLVPAQIDYETGIAHPITAPFFDDDFVLPNPRNRVVAFQRGPFARVVGTGSCLNVRAEPSASAQVLTCLADGVLLRDLSDVQTVDAVTWRHVATAAGQRGWASAVYVEIGQAVQE
jgi:hypothetical protein